ncbi:hypothetical protein FH972_026643 [Carpinus fangiana]|uniref:FAD-binding domain-containing protein n=1 Tax=Carpinus fangiana TaxID=176857 RepID=A0A5N6L5I5_9ROSI|nr:hypothetical protein FH972_026643 [Carpinus fangiana]
MRVLISGAGIAGPTLAWFLAKTGARVTVVEKSRTLLAQGQNIDVNHSALKVAQMMGLMDQIKRFNTTERGTQFIDPKGRPFAPFPVKEGHLSPTSEFEILRGDLATVLFEATKSLMNVNYLLGTTVNQVISNDVDDGVVKVQLSDGNLQEYDLLVIADGQWSKLRQQCFSPECVNIIDKDMYVAYFTVPRLSSDNDWWNIYSALGSRVVTTRPDPHGTIRAMLSLMPCSDAQRDAWQEASRKDKQAQKDLLKRDFKDAGWQAPRLLHAVDETPDFYLQAIQQIRMSKWSISRIVCLGDAAFAPTPLTGAGASLAILGSYVLAGELSMLSPSEHLSVGLERYESKFRRFVEETQQVPSFLPAIGHPKTAGKRWLLQALVSTMSKILAMPWLAHRFSGTQDEDFPLPHYPKFENLSSK